MKIRFATWLCILVPLTCHPFALGAEPGNGQVVVTKTYRNPLLPDLDMADPHVIGVDGKYYLYATWRTKGYDVFVSDDLVNWENRGRVFTAQKGGAWAPDVFHHKRGDGKFYLYYTDDDPAGGKRIGVAVADSPLGPFEDKGMLVKGVIDAHLFHDDDGAFFLYYANVPGRFEIIVQPMRDPLTKQGEPREILRPAEPWETIQGHVTEGPFMLKRNGVYYLMYSGTGADSPNYGIGYATAKSPLGPFTKHPGNPIARRREGLFGPGHHCVVTAPDGKLWMLYHQKRGPEISFKRFLALDPIWFDEHGVIHAKVSKGTDEPAP